MTPPSRDEARERLASCADYPESRRSDGVLLTTVRVDDLRALLSPEQGWREIESAPKDGTGFLVWIAKDEICGPHVFGQVSITSDGAWWDDTTADRIEPIKNATHWMSLPAPPTKGGE